ncbi:MAG: recombinase family protein [Turicibacter sp.]|nr:recombinase family protein [Turicibacter sp.]
MIYGYARVSTHGQDLSLQVEKLVQNGVEQIFQEKISGKSVQREQFQNLLQLLKGGDTVIVTKLDRFARNTREALNVIEPLLEQGIIVKVLNIGTLENSYLGKFILRILLSIAEMERDIIIERTTEGKDRARLNPDFKEGRPKLEITDKHRQAIALLDDMTYFEASKKSGVSISTLHRWRRLIEEE